MATKLAVPEFCVGIGMLTFAGLVGYGTAAIPPSAYAKVGPAVVPWAITAGLVFFAILLMVQALRGGWEHEQGTVLDKRALGWLAAGLILNLILIDGIAIDEKVIVPRIGFIIASTLMFFCTARAFGSEKPVRDGAIGLALAIIAYVGFDRVLGYQIGSGLIERFL